MMEKNIQDLKDQFAYHIRDKHPYLDPVRNFGSWNKKKVTLSLEGSSFKMNTQQDN